MNPPDADPVPWWAHHGNLFSVAQDMVEHGDEADYILDMLEKPWKWQETWERISATREGELAAMRDARELRELREAGARWSDTET